MVQPAAVVQDSNGSGRGCLFAAKDMVQGVSTIAVAAVVFFIIRLKIERAIFFQETVAGLSRTALIVSGVWSRAGVVFGRWAMLDAILAGISGVSFRSRGVEATVQEFPGGGQAMVGFKILEIALHDVNQETDGGAAIVGLFADQDSQILVERNGIGVGNGGLGSSLPGRGGMGGDEGAGRGPTEVEELPGGVKAVARFGICRAALHEVDEKTNDEPSIAGLFANNFRDGRLRVFLRSGQRVR